MWEEVKSKNRKKEQIIRDIKETIKGNMLSIFHSHEDFRVQKNHIEFCKCTTYDMSNLFFKRKI